MATKSPKSIPQERRIDSRLHLISIVYIGLAALNVQAAAMWHIVWHIVVAGLLVLVALLLLKAGLPLLTKRSRTEAASRARLQRP